MTLEERINQCTRNDLLDLFDNAEELHKTGVLPMDAPLRHISVQTFDSDLVTNLMKVSYEVYRALAIPAVTHMKKIRLGAGA